MKKTHLAALVIIGLLVAYIVSQSSSYSTYENFGTAYSNSGKEFQVVGLLEKDDPMTYKPEVDPNLFTFYMKDMKGEVRKVIYPAPKPTDFERSEQIVTTGKMVGEEFHASKILLKCPSKYIEEQIDGTKLEIERQT